MSKILEAQGKQESLTLAASPRRPRVEVKNPEALQPSANLSANALKIPLSHGSGESFISSGCHCTASTHQSSLRDSIPSTIPSGARAVTLSGGATFNTAW